MDEILNDRVDEGLIDFLKSKISKLKALNVKAIADAFFKKYPGLLEAVKAQLNGQEKVAEDVLEEAKFAPKLIMIGALLAVAAGLFPMKAAASTTFTGPGGRMEVSTSSTFLDVFEQLAKEKKPAVSLVQRVQEKFGIDISAVLSDGSIIELRDNSSYIKLSDDMDKHPGQQFIVHSKAVPETGKMNPEQIKVASRAIVDAAMSK